MNCKYLYYKVKCVTSVSLMYNIYEIFLKCGNFNIENIFIPNRLRNCVPVICEHTKERTYSLL